MHVTHRGPAPRTLATAIIAIGLALCAALAFAQAALAVPGPSPYANGLHISTGAISAPDGSIWVADHNAGFCRVKKSADGPGAIEHPQHPGDDTRPTCLGGLLAGAGAGPDAAGQPAMIDPSPDFPRSGDEFALIPDGAAPSADVVRADWNPETGLFEKRDVIVMDADPTEDRPRPVAVSIAPDGDAYVSFQRSGTIQRIVDPESPNPRVELVAVTSDGRGAPALAAVYGADGPLDAPRIVVAETTGLREVTGTATNPGLPRTTQPSEYLLPGATPPAIGALTYEVTNPTSGLVRLYAGTADSLPAAEGGDPDADRVLRWDEDGLPTPHGSGFSTIGGFGPVVDGRLLVVDDPALVTPGEPIGFGRMFSVGETWARVVAGPQGPTNDARPTFRFQGEGAAECRLDGGAWQQGCTSPFQPAEALAAGDHTFAVRSAGSDLVDVRRFEVDLTAPTGAPKVVSPANGSFTSNRPYFEFKPAQGEDEGTYECRISPATTFTPCEEGRPATGLSAGEHTMVIRARDVAGNPGTFDDTSPVSEGVSFTVGEPAPGAPVEEPQPAELAAPRSVVRLADGLHIATGAFEGPHGSLWVTDHNAGLCRVSKPGFDAPGAIEHPEVPNGGGENTCLGGLRPEAREGADAAGQPVLLDPTPRNAGSGDEVVIVPDGATKSATLWRAQWNPGSKRFDPLDAIDGPLSARGDRGPRPTAAALGPDPDGPNGPRQPDVFYVTKTDDFVVRIRNAASTDPDRAPEFAIVGRTASGLGAEALAVGQRTVEGEKRPVLYIGELTGVTRLIPGVDTEAQSLELEGLGPAASIGAVAYDKVNQRLYVGTSEAAGDPEAGVAGTPDSDRVLRFTVAGTDGAEPATPQLDGGPIGTFNMIGGMGVRRDGQLLVTDDVALTLPDEPIGTGRLYGVGSPEAHVVDGPSDVGGEALDPSFTSDATPEFRVKGDAPLECVVRKDGETPAPDAWKACSASPAVDGVQVVEAAGLLGVESLADGRYVLSVRSAKGATPETKDDTSLFVPESLPFTVDTQAPGRPGVAVTLEEGKSNAAPWFTFTPAAGTDDAVADLAWRCTLNGAESSCHPGRTYPLNADGSSKLAEDNDLEVTAIDKAGNESPAGSLSWLADVSLPKVTITGPGAEGEALVRQTSTSATFTVKVEDEGLAPAAPGVGCRLDGELWKRCNPDGETYERLTEGTHVFKAHARDAYGNMSATATKRLVVDTTAPVLTFGGAAPTGPTGTLTFAVDPESVSEGERQTFTCSLDGGPAAECNSGSFAFAGLAAGPHTLTVVATDDLGNTSTRALNWTVVAPAATPPAGGPGPGAGGGQGRGNGGRLDGQGRGRGRGGLAVVQVAPTLQAAALRAQGLPVTVRPTAGNTTVQIRVFRLGGGRFRAAAAGTAAKRLVATVTVRTPKAKTYRLRLKDRRLRGLKPGRYQLEVRAGKSRASLGTASTRTFVVRGR